MASKKSVIEAELTRIARKNNGVLTAEMVVAAARDEDSPLHDSFTWDNDVAAERWRLYQARNLILHVKVETTAVNNHRVIIRAWTSLTTDRNHDGGGYRETIHVLSNKDQRRQLLADALAELKLFEEKYRTLKELAGVFAQIRKVGKREAA